MKIFHGAALFIWKVKECVAWLDPTSPEARKHILKVMDAIHLDYLLVKVADRSSIYNQHDVTGKGNVWQDTIIPPLVAAAKAAGKKVIGWGFVYGDDPIAEAKRTIERIQTLGLDGYVINAEVHYKQKGKDRAAESFMTMLKNTCPNLPLALSSYRYPVSLHSDFPWRSFAKYLDPSRDAWMPQVYWIGDYTDGGPAYQLARSVDELNSIKRLPIVPTGPLWQERYKLKMWEPNTKQLGVFLNAARELKLPGVNMWSWDALAHFDGREPAAQGSRGWWTAASQIHGMFADGESEKPPAPVPEFTQEQKVGILWREADQHQWSLTA